MNNIENFNLKNNMLIRIISITEEKYLNKFLKNKELDVLYKKFYLSC